MEQDAVIVRVAPPLRLFLARRHRGGDPSVTADGTSTLGHVVQSLGVPLTEVGALRVDDRPVPPSYRPLPGDVVDVTPMTRPQRIDPEAFLLDVHLGALARRMRLLGIDTAWPHDGPDAVDDALVAAANAEGRLLLTKDRRLLQRRALRRGAFVRGDGPDDQLQDVLDRFAPALAPWTRCIAYNALLVRVDKDEVAHLLQPGTRRTYDEFARCTVCRRVFWRGAHAARLSGIVAAARAKRA